MSFTITLNLYTVHSYDILIGVKGYPWLQKVYFYCQTLMNHIKNSNHVKPGFIIIKLKIFAAEAH